MNTNIELHQNAYILLGSYVKATKHIELFDSKDTNKRLLY